MPQNITRFAGENQQDAMEFIEAMLDTIRIKDRNVLGYTECNTITCTEIGCEKNSVITQEELVYRVDIKQNSVNGCLRHQLESPTEVKTHFGLFGVPRGLWGVSYVPVPSFPESHR